MGNDGKMERKIRGYIENRASTKLEDFDKKTERQKRDAYPDELFDLVEKLSEERDLLSQKYRVDNWLTDAASRANQINLVTHAPKFTHSDTRSIGVLYAKRGDGAQVKGYLCSSSLQDMAVDVVGNAAALDVAGLLQLSVNGISLLDEITTGNSETLKSLANSEEQYRSWLDGFSEALQGKSLTSGQLSKQLYYPVKNSYHLLSPLYSSSLSQALYLRLTHAAYAEESKAARKARKSSLYYDAPVVSFPNVAQQGFGGTKPQNISKLNSSRYGRGFLLSCQPPVWQQQLKPPVSGKNSFWQGYSRRSRKAAAFLKDYLEQIYEQPSIKERKDFRGELVDELIDTLLIYAAEIQALSEHAGWSCECDLSHAEQLWLDPHRCLQDEGFKFEREQNDWQLEIARQFASWLNHKIGHKSEKLFPDDHTHHEWTRLLKRKLALLKEDLEVIA